MRKIFICGIAFFLGAPLAAGGADDWGTWNDYAFRVPIKKEKLYLKSSFQTRFRKDLDEFYYYHFYFGPEYKPLKWLMLSAQYANVNSGPPGDFRTEHRPMFFVTPSFSMADLGVDKNGYLGPLTLQLQNQLWWRIRPYAAHTQTWRYSIFPTLSYPVLKTEKLTISPYAGNDFYYDLTNNIGYNENRLYGGFRVRLFKKVVVNLFYMRRAFRPGRGGDWDGSHVVGTGLLLDF